MWHPFLAHPAIDESVLAFAVQPDRRPAAEGDLVAAWASALGANRLSRRIGRAPVPRKSRYRRYSRYKPCFISIFCVDRAATNLNATRYRRYTGVSRA
jgi:hypothetical protein